VNVFDRASTRDIRYGNTDWITDTFHCRWLLPSYSSICNNSGSVTTELQASDCLLYSTLIVIKLSACHRFPFLCERLQCPTVSTACFTSVASLVCSWNLKMERARSSKTSQNYQNTSHHISEDSTLQIRLSKMNFRQTFYSYERLVRWQELVYWFSIFCFNRSGETWLKFDLYFCNFKKM
jgi:hypothetical protein